MDVAEACLDTRETQEQDQDLRTVLSVLRVLTSIGRVGVLEGFGDDGDSMCVYMRVCRMLSKKAGEVQII